MPAPQDLLDVRLDGRVAIVTGAAQGIGLAATELLVRAGATVVGADLAPSAALRAVLPAVDVVTCDVADPDAVAALVDDVVARHGRIDVVHGNAGINIPGRLHSLTVEQYRTVMGVCLDANVFLVQRCAPHMRADGGAFVFTSSMCGVRATPRSPAYNMAKHALTGLVQSIALDYGAQGIRAVAIVTGPTATPMIDDLWGQDGPLRAGLEGLTVVGRLADPHEIARAVLFAAAPSSTFMTGCTLTVDGGAGAGWTSLADLMFTPVPVAT